MHHAMRALLAIGCLRAAALAAPAKVEVIVSHFNEDLSWVEKYKSPQVQFTVYSKASSPPAFARRLPNVGRESHTYLHHIVQHYERLADWSVFTQGVRPSWGYRGAGPVSGHLTDNVLFEDYLQPFSRGRDSFFALSAASQFPSGQQTNRMGFMLPLSRPESLSKEACPAGGEQSWTPWWWDSDHPQLRRRNASEPSMLEFYHRYVARDEYTDRPLTLAFAQGARFAVSRARVHRRPLEYYASLLEQLSRGVSPIQGYWMEAAWFDVFHPEALQSTVPACALPPASRFGLSVPQLKESIARRLLAEGHADARLLVAALHSYTYTYTGAYTPAPTLPPWVTDKAVVEGSTTVRMENPASVVQDAAIREAFREQLAETAGCLVHQVDVALRTGSRRLSFEMRGRRLEEGPVTADYTITVPVKLDGTPYDSLFDPTAAASALAGAGDSFAAGLLAKILASASPLADDISQITVTRSTAEAKPSGGGGGGVQQDEARGSAAIAVAYTAATVAAAIAAMW